MKMKSEEIFGIHMSTWVSPSSLLPEHRLSSLVKEPSLSHSSWCLPKESTGCKIQQHYLNTVFHRSTLMSNILQTQRSNFPSSFCRPLRFLLWHHHLLLMALDSNHLGTQTHQHGALYHHNHQQQPNLQISHLPMEHITCTLLYRILTINISDGTVKILGQKPPLSPAMVCNFCSSVLIQGSVMYWTIVVKCVASFPK